MSGLTLSAIMRRERALYIDARAEKGGTADGFRQWVKERSDADPRLFSLDALRDEAATKIWQEQPRKRGPDLFSIGGVEVPEFLTRSKGGHLDGDDIDDEEGFEKVGAKFATVNDRFEDAIIKMRQAARASAAAERTMQQADECRRRAKGDMSKFLRDIAD